MLYDDYFSVPRETAQLHRCCARDISCMSFTASPSPFTSFSLRDGLMNENIRCYMTVLMQFIVRLPNFIVAVCVGGGVNSLQPFISLPPFAPFTLLSLRPGPSSECNLTALFQLLMKPCKSTVSHSPPSLFFNFLHPFFIHFALYAAGLHQSP